jgi:hypothetical protein
MAAVGCAFLGAWLAGDHDAFGVMTLAIIIAAVLFIGGVQLWTASSRRAITAVIAPAAVVPYDVPDTPTVSLPRPAAVGRAPAPGAAFNGPTLSHRMASAMKERLGDNVLIAERPLTVDRSDEQLRQEGYFAAWAEFAEGMLTDRDDDPADH